MLKGCRVIWFRVRSLKNRSEHTRCNNALCKEGDCFYILVALKRTGFVCLLEDMFRMSSVSFSTCLQPFSKPQDRLIDGSLWKTVAYRLQHNFRVQLYWTALAYASERQPTSGPRHSKFYADTHTHANIHTNFQKDSSLLYNCLIFPHLSYCILLSYYHLGYCFRVKFI